MNRYRLRIPSISLTWKYVDAENPNDAIDIVVGIINSDSIDYSDRSVWQVEKVEKGKVNDE